MTTIDTPEYYEARIWELEKALESTLEWLKALRTHSPNIGESIDIVEAGIHQALKERE